MSILRVAAAFLLSVAMAVPIGILMSSYRVVGAALEPVVDFIRYLPVPTLVPLGIIWLDVKVVTLKWRVRSSQFTSQLQTRSLAGARIACEVVLDLVGPDIGPEEVAWPGPKSR